MSIAVLLVDDNALFRDGLAHILQADGRFDIVGQVSRGDEGVAAADRLRPDLIMIDLHMPGISGVDAIRQIRASSHDVAIGVQGSCQRTRTGHAAQSRRAPSGSQAHDLTAG